MMNRNRIALGKLTAFVFLVFACTSCSPLKSVVREHTDREVESAEESIHQDVQWKVEFEENFSSYDLGTEPDSLFILDGAYEVREETEQKVLTLPGSPVGDFGFLFGPRVREKTLELQFTFKSAKKGRRFPSIAAGLGGVRAFRFRLNPAARKLLVYADGRLLGERSFVWLEEAWWKVRLEASPLSEERSRVRLKLWPESKGEPDNWLFDQETEFAFKGGKCAIWGYPYAGTEIHFDELIIRSKEP